MFIQRAREEVRTGPRRGLEGRRVHGQELVPGPGGGARHDALPPEHRRSDGDPRAFADLIKHGGRGGTGALRNSVHANVGPKRVEGAILEAALQRGAEVGGENAQAGGEDEQQRQPGITRRVPGELPEAEDERFRNKPVQKPARQRPRHQLHRKREEPQEHKAGDEQEKRGRGKRDLVYNRLAEQVFTDE